VYIAELEQLGRLALVELVVEGGIGSLVAAWDSSVVETDTVVKIDIVAEIGIVFAQVLLAFQYHLRDPASQFHEQR